MTCDFPSVVKEAFLKRRVLRKAQRHQRSEHGNCHLETSWTYRARGSIDDAPIDHRVGVRSRLKDPVVTRVSKPGAENRRFADRSEVENRSSMTSESKLGVPYIGALRGKKPFPP